MKRYRQISVVLIACFLFSAGCSKTPEEKMADYTKSAMEYMENEKYDEASIQLRNALKIAPDNVENLIALGKVQIKRKKPREAFAAFLRASKADPENLEAREYLASMFLLAKQYTKAIEQCRFILKHKPRDEKISLVLAQSLFFSDKKEEAVEIMEGLMREATLSEGLVINACQMYLGAGMGDKALSTAIKGAELLPKSTKIRFFISDIYAGRKEIKKATFWAQKAYAVSGNDLMAGLALTRFYAEHNMDSQFSSMLDKLKKTFSDKPEPFLLEARVLSAKKDIKGALRAARHARDLDDSLKTSLVLAQLLMQEDNIREATDLLVKGIEENKNAMEPRILLAKIYLREKKAEQCLKTLEPALEKMSTMPDVAYIASSAYMMQGKTDKANVLIDQALRRTPDNPLLNSMMARIHFRQGKYKEVLRDIKGIRSLQMFYIGAISAIKTGDNETGRHYADLLSEISPDAWASQHARVLADLSEGRDKQAFETMKDAIKAHPDNAQALSIYAIMAPGIQGVDKTISRISDICSQNSTTACHMILSNLFEKDGEKDEALGELDKAIALAPDNPMLNQALASFYTRNNMTQKAMDEYNNILNTSPDDLNAATMLALLYQKKERFKDAEKIYDYILDKDPSNGLAANNLAWILADKGKKRDLPRAMELSQKAKDAYPEDPRIADTLGFVYLEKDMAVNAESQFSFALEKMPNAPEINYHMALALIRQDKQKEAVFYLKKALEQEFKDKKDARKCLDEIMDEIMKDNKAKGD
ncbi:MAG: CDC27 family protein [Thermodesulfobacteriota bacterium]|nr:CDC27 family protein [Thermodesulfobacteriota bacterium]